MTLGTDLQPSHRTNLSKSNEKINPFHSMPGEIGKNAFCYFPARRDSMWPGSRHSFVRTSNNRIDILSGNIFYYVCIHITALHISHSVFYLLFSRLFRRSLARARFIVCIFCPGTDENENGNVMVFRVRVTRTHNAIAITFLSIRLAKNTARIRKGKK